MIRKVGLSKLDDENRNYFDSTEKYSKLSNQKYEHLEINKCIYKNSGILWEIVDNEEVTFYIYK
jgi:hypothetical protein